MSGLPSSRVSRGLRKFSQKVGLFVDLYRPNHVYVDRARFRDGAVSSLPADKTNEVFYQIAGDVINDGRTFLRFERLFVLWQAIRNVARLGLPAVEVGSYRGGSSYFIASAFRAFGAEDIPIHVIDTFEGHLVSEIDEEIDTYHKPGMFTETSFEEVRKYLSVFNNVTVHKMSSSQMAGRLPEMTYSFAHVDVDIYLPTKECLDYFIPRLATGGVIVVDDFEARKCPGVKKAIEETVRKYPELHTWHMQTEQIVLVKNP